MENAICSGKPQRLSSVLLDLFQDNNTFACMRTSEKWSLWSFIKTVQQVYSEYNPGFSKKFWSIEVFKIFQKWNKSHLPAFIVTLYHPNQTQIQEMVSYPCPNYNKIHTFFWSLAVMTPFFIPTLFSLTKSFSSSRSSFADLILSFSGPYLSAPAELIQVKTLFAYHILDILTIFEPSSTLNMTYDNDLMPCA